jgi:MoaA/NifB/PqqE/SkfB family radical SAM enzyme
VTNAPGEEGPDALGDEALAAVLNESFRTARRLDVSLVAPETKRGLKCTWPRDNAYITVAGKVTPCCYRAVPYPANVLGDLNAERFDAVWSSAAYESLRAAVARGSFDAECRRFGCRYQNASETSRLGRLVEQLRP